MAKKSTAKKLATIGVMILFGMLLLAAGLPEAQAGDTTEAILDILHEKGDITDQEYEELKKKAKEEDQGFKTYFDKRLHIDSPDGRFKFRIGGRILLDAAAIDADDGFEAAEDAAGQTFEGTGVEFRQARLHMMGLLYDHVAFKNEFDFAGEIG